LAGENKDAVENSPLIERLVKRGYEVLFMVDPIDEDTLSNMGDKFDGKQKLTNLAREGVKLDGEVEDEEKEKSVQTEFEPLLKFLKKTLGNKIEKAVVSKRLSTSPSALASSSWGWTPNMERIVKAQALGDSNKQNQFYTPKKILEINVRHPLVQELKKRVEADEEDKTATDISFLMLDTAALASGWNL